MPLTLGPTAAGAGPAEEHVPVAHVEPEFMPIQHAKSDALCPPLPAPTGPVDVYAAAEATGAICILPSSVNAISVQATVPAATLVATHANATVQVGDLEASMPSAPTGDADTNLNTHIT